MNRQIPMYENNGNSKLAYNSEKNCYEQSYIIINITAPINSIDEVKYYLTFWNLINTINDCDEIKATIDDIKTIKQLFIKPDTQKKNIETAFRQIPFQYRHLYEDIIKELKTHLLSSQNLSAQFIYNNKEELKLFVTETKNRLANIIKEKRTVANKTYYEKKKEILGKTARVLLTEEEKKQRRQTVNKNNYKTKIEN